MQLITAKETAIQWPITPRAIESIDLSLDRLFTNMVTLQTILDETLTPSAGTVVYSTATGLGLTARGTTGQVLRSAGSSTPTWSTAIYPATTTINQLLYSSAANTITGLATVNYGVLTTGSAGVPAWVTPVANGVLVGANTTGAPGWLAPAASAMLTTSAGSVPGWVTTLPSGMLPSNVLTE